MRKTRIEIRANIATHADTHEAARFGVNDWRKMTNDMADSDGEAEINPTNVKLAKFGIYTKTSLWTVYAKLVANGR